MKIIAGWNYDGGACPDELESAEAVEGIVIVGQLGLAAILETRLGLAQADPSQAVRIACYLRTLEGMCVSGNPFFKASFVADGWATAKRLLAERDHLALSCWNDTPCGSPRLDTLAALHAAADCPPGLPDRLARIFEAMQAHGAPGIRRIEMETPCECWPKLWRSIFDAMRQASVEIADTPSVDQRLLPEECLPRVRPLHAPTLCAAADAVAAWLAANKDNSEVLLVVETGGEVLDAALRRHGLPITGATTRSIHRAALQVLPLALELCWSPLSPAALLDFLTVPVCPLHPAMSRWLVRALENHPGTGGPEWSAALDKCRTWGQGRPGGDLLVADLDFWMGLKRSPRGGELDAIVVLTICERLAEWSSTRPPKGTAHLLSPIAAMAQAVIETVRASGRRGFTKPQLDRILDSVVGGGISSPTKAEAASWSVAGHPGQVRGSFKDIIWWNFSDPGQLAARPIWDNAEQAALRAAGADLEDHQRLSSIEATSWRRPLLLATGQLILVMVDSDKGQPLTPHPLWDELIAVPGAEALFLAQTEDASIIESGPGATLCGRKLRLKEIPSASPVMPVRIWPVPPHITARRAAESPSGMTKLLECPLRWLLDYAIHLRTGHLASLPDGNQLLGSFCHRLVELLVAENPAWDPQEACARGEQLFDELLGQMAATLKLPGRDAELSMFRIHAIKAVEQLFERVRSAGLTIHGCEQRLERVDDSGQAHVGYADLLLRDAKGNVMPWDMKWNNSSKYKRQELEEGRALQLAAYSWMLGSPGAHAAYFMLKQAELISTQTPWASAQESVQTDLSALWEHSLATYHQRVKELELGEAFAGGIPPEGEELTEPAPRCGYCDYSTICGVRYAE